MTYIHFFSKNWYIVSNVKNTFSVISCIVPGKAHNGFVVTTLPDAISSEYNINIYCLMPQIWSLCDVTHIVNVTSYRVDEMSYIMHVME